MTKILNGKMKQLYCSIRCKRSNKERPEKLHFFKHINIKTLLVNFLSKVLFLCSKLYCMGIAGCIACLFIGIILGLIGGGGSILTVPVLVYSFFIPPAIAISYLLFFVGVTSLLSA